MQTLTGHRIAILATHGFEQSELEVPLRKLAAAGAEMQVISLDEGSIRGWDGDDWGDTVAVDKTLDKALVGDYAALVLPGGQINPDILRADAGAVAFVQAFADAEKPIAAICHAPWLLIEADLVRGRSVTGYPSIRTDLRNAGATVLDEAAVIDGRIVTSRNPDDLDAFCEAIAELVAQQPAQAA